MPEQLHLSIRYSDADGGWITAQVAGALDLLLTPDEQLAGEPVSADSESLTLTIA